MLKKIFVMTQVLLVGLGLIVTGIIANNQPSSASAAAIDYTSSWDRAAVIYPNYTHELVNPNFYKLVDRAKSDNLNHISIVVQYFQANLNDSNLYLAPYAPSDEELNQALKYIKDQGMSSSIKMFIDVDYKNDNVWRAYIKPTNRQAWFDNYRSLVTKYGKIAENQSSTLFSIGTEMIELSRDDRSPIDTSNWNKIISELRSVYKGKITYGQNSYGENEDINGIKFLNNLDVIGISAYYPLSSNPNSSVSDLKKAWQEIENNKILPLKAAYQKPIMFTELGYRNVDSTLDKAWLSTDSSDIYNESAQANAYQALIEYFKDKSYFTGWHIWHFDTNISPASSGDMSYSPLNKAAEKVLQNSYSAFSSVFSSSSDNSNSNTNSSTSSSSATISSSSSSQPQSLFSTQIVSSNPTKINITNNSNNKYQNLIVDLELFDSKNTKVAQDYQEKQNFAPGQTLSYTPNFAVSKGIYTLKVGIFKTDWTGTIEWNDDAGKLEIASNQNISISPIISSQNSSLSSTSSSVSSNSKSQSVRSSNSSSKTTSSSSKAVSSSSSSKPNQNNNDLGLNWIQDLFARVMLGSLTFGALLLKK